MIKRIVCCALALFLFSLVKAAALAATVSPADFRDYGRNSIVQISDNGAEHTASITGYGLIVPRATPGGGGGNGSDSSGNGSSIRDGDIPSANLETIPEAEIPFGAPSQNSPIPYTGVAVDLDLIWMLLILSFITIILTWPKKEKTDPLEPVRNR